MPVGMRLECPPRLDDRKIVARSADKLQSHREILFCETAGNGHCWKPADIPDATQRVGECQIGLEIHG